MTEYKINRDTILLEKPDKKAKKLKGISKGTHFSGDRIVGENKIDVFIKTIIDNNTGYVWSLRADEAPGDTAEPIAPDEFEDFRRLVQRTAEEESTDPMYLMAVAYTGTDNLTNLGGPGDGKLGPFQFSAQEWEAAITTGPARDKGLRPEDRFSWRFQPRVAAALAADCVKRLQAALGRLPTRLELYFAQLFGPGAEQILKKPATDLCKDAIQEEHAAGSYAAELANSDQTIGRALDELRTRLATGLVATGMLGQEDPAQFLGQTPSAKTMASSKESGRSSANVPEQAVSLIKKFEGFRAAVYDDGTGVWTIGWGTTIYPTGNKKGKKVERGDPDISKDTADGYFLHDIVPTVKKLESSIPFWQDMDDNQRSALISFAYNLGKHFYNSRNFETITADLQSKRWDKVPKTMEMYSNPNDPAIHEGLLKRRKAEGQLWQGKGPFKK